MDWQQYEAYCRQFVGPCGKHWEPDCQEGCHSPCTPWNDRPTGHMSPPPSMRFDPVPPPKPISGDSPMEVMNRLYAEVCAAMKQCGELNAKTERLLKDIHEHGLRNGVYYSPDIISVEEGYCEEDSAPYKIVRIKPVDKYGNPVEIKMHLAYGNTTNSGIKEKITDASLYELAQIIVPATGKTESWDSYVVYQQAPLPATVAENGHTYGFTKRGKLKVYRNDFIKQNPEILKRDGIVNAMGCDGILIKDGVIVVSGLAEVKNYSIKASRVMLGQNANTGETIILDAGAFGDGYEGLRGESAVNILMGYGCTNAVQLVSGELSATLNQGELLSPPENNKIPECLAYLYVSKKCFFKNELQFTIAYLTQALNQTKLSIQLSHEELGRLSDKLTQEVDDRAQADAELTGKLQQEESARQAEDSKLDAAIKEETKNRTENDDEFTKKLEQEAADRYFADTEDRAYTDEKVKAEKDERVNEDNTIKQSVEQEAADRFYADSQLQEKIDKEADARSKQDLYILQTLNDEIGRSKREDEELNRKLTDEINTARQNEANLTNELRDEINRATSQETYLGNEIADEVQRATAQEADLAADLAREVSRALANETNLLAEFSRKVFELQEYINSIMIPTTKVEEYWNGEE